MNAADSLAGAFARLSPRRPHGICAVLLPYTEAGRADWAAFERLLLRVRDAGLDAAVNMDTGFGDLLSAPEREAVLGVARRALGPSAALFAGAYAVAGEADPAKAYRPGLTSIAAHGATPVVIQCAAMHGLEPDEKLRFYARLLEGTGRALGFELAPVFAPHGEIWSDACFERLLGLPALCGSKHSSLDRPTELRRLAARDRLRPDYRLYTGNDLAIDLVAYGSDYLLGLATFAPECFAERDRALAAGDVGFLARNDALQHLGNVAFRAPVPAYKHAAAQFLHLTGWLDGDAIHPGAPRRPASDRVLLFDCARRLDLLADPERTWAERVAPFLSERAAPCL